MATFPGSHEPGSRGVARANTTFRAPQILMTYRSSSPGPPRTPSDHATTRGANSAATPIEPRIAVSASRGFTAAWIPAREGAEPPRPSRPAL